MEATSWLKQTPDKPLFPELLWSRPENRNQAGKLLIIGGNLYGFAAAAEAYAAAVKAGAGTARVLLPGCLQKTVGKMFPEAEFAASTPSGSFARAALGVALEAAQWADGVLIAGDLGRNSETSILLETFAGKYAGQLTITKDAADYFTGTPGALLMRPDTLLVITLTQLQKLAKAAHFTTAFTFEMDLLRFAEALGRFAGQHGLHLVVKHGVQIFAASGSRVSSTLPRDDRQIWRVAAAARAATWWLQNPGKTFEAVTTSLMI